MATILDVVDNYLSYKKAEDIGRMPGRTLMGMADEVNRFAAAYDVPEPVQTEHPIYIGGWPSANVWATLTGQLTLLGLLYCGQVFAKDPISDWFAPEQYQSQHLASDRRGFIAEDGRRNVVGTRAYLASVVPGLRKLRPLIEAGAIVLMPSESYLVRARETVNATQGLLMGHLEPRVADITARFHPADVTVGDNRKGMFVFAGGGDREQQYRRVIGESVTYFVRELAIARGHGVNYAAPFSYEQFLCESGLEPAVAESSGFRIVHALWNSSLPAFQGLTPKLVADVRKDDVFASFRSTLSDTYRDIPTGSDSDVARYIAENERAKLQPMLSKAEREARSGILQRLGITPAGVAFSLATAFAPAAATGQLDHNALIRGGATLALDAIRRARYKPPSLWTRLYKHGRKYTDELAPVAQSVAVNPPGPEPWAIAERPTDKVSVTAGAVLFERAVNNTTKGGTYSLGDYRACDCGSGLKYKFCCRGLPGR